MNEQLNIRQRRRELLITVAFTIFSVLMIIVTAIEHWPVLYVPLISFEVGLIWWSYIRKIKNYAVRAVLVTAATCVNIFLYGINGENFYVLIPTLCVEFVLLSLYEMTQIMGISILQSVLLLIYQIAVHTDAMIPQTTLEVNRYMLQLLSFVVLIALCIYRIRHQIQEEEAFEDLEARVKMEQKIKDDFMVNTSHELRTPINTVSGMCDILLQKDLPDDVHADVLDIQMTGVELQNIVTDIMDYSALEADTMELSVRAYSITSTLNDVMNMTMFENRDKQLEIIFDCDPNIPRLLEGDEHQIRRILNNLIGNAIKFTTEGGVIVRVSYRPEQYGINLIISVRDTGVGIDLNDQDTILRGFYQAEGDRNRRNSGMGLGLTISSALVNKMGGFLTIKSTVGEGSEFSFAIPQRVLDDQPCISLMNPGLIRLVWYYKPHSPVPTVRDSFVEHIKHFSDYFGIVSQQTDSLEECKRRLTQSQGVHLIIGKSEYMEDPEYFDELSKTVPIILVADRSDVISASSRIHVLHKPYNAIMLAEIFNGRDITIPKHEKKKVFTAPSAKILVVDDNLMNLKVVEGMLRKYRIKILAASSGEEALDMINSKDYDFVFMDHMMPGMDGVECFHHIREKEGSYFSTVPVIALTANAIAGSREMFLSEGFNDFIAKPVDSSLMNDMLQKYIPPSKIIYEDDESEDGASEAKATAASDIKATEPAKEETAEEPGVRSETAAAATGAEEQVPAAPEPSGEIIDEEEQETRNDEDMEAFENLEGIDKETALMYCGTVEDFKELAEVYCETGFGYAKELKEACDSMDIEKYALLSHTVKSTSKTLGALKLSEMALGQEMAAKNKDEEEVRAKHQAFITEYENILDRLYAFTGGEKMEEEVRPVSGEAEEVENWNEIKQNLKDSLEAFESKAFEDGIEGIKGKTIDGKPVEDILAGVIEKASNFDFDGAIEELNEIGGKA